MSPLRTTLLALALGFAALPVAAGGIAFDLPHLTFPAPHPDVTRDCAAATCLPATR